MSALKKVFLFIPSRIKRFFTFFKEVKTEIKEINKRIKQLVIQM